MYGAILATTDQQSGISNYFSYDGNGNVVNLVDENNAVTASYTYDPFGNRIDDTADDTADNPYQWSTKLFHEPSGLVAYEYRFYDPILGRWLQRDGLSENGAYNLYNFVGNSVENYVDPLGFIAYKIGTEDPPVVREHEGSVRIPVDKDLSEIKAKLLGDVLSSGHASSIPDAVAHLRHFLNNSGTPYDIRILSLLNDTNGGKASWETELKLAIAYAEKLGEGTHSITSGHVAVSSVKPWDTGDANGVNWYLATHGFQRWGKGKVTCVKGEVTLEFEYKFFDRYNWDIGKQIDVSSFLGMVPKSARKAMGLEWEDLRVGKYSVIENGIINDSTMKLLSASGIAEEYDLVGSTTKTVKWTKGQTQNIDISPPKNEK